MDPDGYEHQKQEFRGRHAILFRNFEVVAELGKVDEACWV